MCESHRDSTYSAYKHIRSFTAHQKEKENEKRKKPQHYILAREKAARRTFSKSLNIETRLQALVIAL
jgi:hypothetical protein